jgi:hypothetical protein
MGACATKVDVIEPQMNLQSMDERIGEMLRLMDAYHCQNISLLDYYRMGMQDAQYSPNMTIQDKINLNKIGDIIRAEPSRGDKEVGYYLTTDDKLFDLALKAESNMIKVLNDNPKLKSWFIAFDPPNYMFNPHPNLQKLSTLVDEDGHSGASFAMCCQSVRRKLLKYSM